MKVNFDKRLKELRLEMGLTQSELAKKLKVTQATVAKWENGDLEPSLDMLRDMKVYFGVTVDDLLGLED